MVTGSACNFDRDYENGQSPLMRGIELQVQGSDYGATSWTTRAQAEATANRLGLGPGNDLLELGAGAGWPALYLAKLTGCAVVMTDLPLSGLRAARARAMQDGLEARCRVVAADGAALPFADASFGLIHHADVLCCMAPKRRMLQECRRVGRAGARMEFAVITLVREPSDAAEQALLEKSGPPFPDAGIAYTQLLHDTGWTVHEHLDVTPEFARCMDVLLQQHKAHRTALAGLLGAQQYIDHMQRRACTREAVRRGLLRREIFCAG